MNKAQLLILLLIIALVFYYLTENNSPKTPPLIKKPQPKPTSIINLPASKTETKRPSDIPIIEFPSAQWADEPNHPEPSQFKGINPPHSQVDERWEPPEPTKPPKPPIKLPPSEPQPTKKTLNHSAPEFVPATEPSLNKSELTLQEKALRQAQELSDYNWLLNNKTIADWHHEQKLTSSQFQVLRTLVSQEEMNTLSYFLNLLPINYEWVLLSSEFKTQPSLIEQWKPNFTYLQTQDWLKVGLQPIDYALATWLQKVKKLTPEETLNFGNLEKLKEEFNGN